MLGSYCNKLDHLVLIDDLAGRGGNVLAQLERIEVGHPDVELALAALEIPEHVLQAVDQILAAGFDGEPHHFGIGHREVAGRHRIDELAGIELELLLGLVVEAFDVGDHVLNPAGGQQIGLLDVRKQGIILPVIVLEALVALLLADDRFHRLTEHGRQGFLPQFHIVLPQGHLRLRQLAGIRHDLLVQFHEGLGQGHLVLHVKRAFSSAGGSEIP